MLDVLLRGADFKSRPTTEPTGESFKLLVLGVARIS
jgi:hypothetical protein